MSAQTLRKIGWFFLRDLAIARSYRAIFVFEMPLQMATNESESSNARRL
jgi:hypothetical protein